MIVTFLSMSLNFIIAWNNEKWYNKRDLIWRFTWSFYEILCRKLTNQSLLTKSNDSNTGQSVLKSKGLYRTSGHFTGLVRRYFVFTAFYSSILQNDHLYWWTIKKFIAMSSSTNTGFFSEKVLFHWLQPIYTEWAVFAYFDKKKNDI